MVYGLWFMVYVSGFRVYGLWFMVYGSWFMVRTLGFMVYVLWLMVKVSGAGVKGSPKRFDKLPCSFSISCLSLGFGSSTLRVYVAGFGNWGSGFRNHGLGSRVGGLEFWV